MSSMEQPQKSENSLSSPWIFLLAFLFFATPLGVGYYLLHQIEAVRQVTPEMLDQRVSAALESTAQLRSEFYDFRDSHDIAKEVLGASGNEIPTAVALFETSLASKITSSATSMTLVSALDKTGTALASSTYSFILDEGLSTEEMVIADCTSTACTNMIRGLSPLTGTSTVSALQFEHRRGASVKITDGPQLLILSRMLNGQGQLPNLIRYRDATTDCSGLVDNDTICDKEYIDAQVSAGASDANTTTKGLVEIATKLETASSTQLGGTGAFLAMPAEHATDTPSGTSYSGSKSVISKMNGKIHQLWIDLTEAFTWTGIHTFDNDVDIAAESGNPLILRGLSYIWPASHVATGTCLTNGGSGSLLWNQECGRVKSVVTNTLTLSNNAASTTMATTTLEASELGTEAVVEIVCDISALTFGGATGSISFNLKYADQLIASTSITGAGTSGVASGEMRAVMILNGASVQKGHIDAILTAGGVSGGAAPGLVMIAKGRGTGTVNSAVPQSFGLEAKWVETSSSLSMTVPHCGITVN